MNRGLDTDVLVKAHIADSNEHRRVREFLRGQFSRSDLMLFITPSVLAEFLHVATDARRFQPPLTIDEAVQVGRFYLGRPNVIVLGADAGAMHLALDMLKRHQLGRKRILDTLLAATLLSQGVNELITCNPRDYTVFADLTLIDPRRTI